MKELKRSIESNKKLLEDAIRRRKTTVDEETKKRLTILIERYDYYIKGLEDAKKYIEEESKEVD